MAWITLGELPLWYQTGRISLQWAFLGFLWLRPNCIHLGFRTQRATPSPVVHSQPEKKTKVAKLIWGSKTTDFLLRTSKQMLSPQSVQFSSVAQSCLTLCDPMDCSAPGFPVHHQLLELAQFHVHRVSDAIQPSHHLSPTTFNLSQHQRLFQRVGFCIRWPKYWSFSFSISPSNEHSGLISFRLDWLDLIALQGTLKSLLQHHSSKTSNLRHSAFFIVQLSHSYMTTGKVIALTGWTFVSKVMSLLFNVLSRLFIAFIPRSKHLWSIFMAAVTICSDFGAQKK